MAFISMNAAAIYLLSLLSIVLLFTISTIHSFQFERPPNADLSAIAIVEAIRSNNYLISIISSIAMSVHLLFDFVGHIFLYANELSYRDSFSKLVILSFLLVPDIAQLFFVIPDGNYFAYSLIRYIRIFCWISATFGYLAQYGGKFWNSTFVILGVITFDIGCLLKFSSYFKISFSILRMIGNCCCLMGILFFIIVTFQYIYYEIIKHKKYTHFNANIYCCNVYLIAFWTTCIGLCVLSVVNNFPDWYEMNTWKIIIETMLYTIYYILITVFQGKAALIDAISCKVSSNGYIPTVSIIYLYTYCNYHLVIYLLYLLFTYIPTVSIINV